MRYLTSPYKRSQLLLALIDAAAASGLLALGLWLYPHRVFLPILAVWPLVATAALFVAGCYDLAPERLGASLLLRMAAALSVAALATYPFLSGSDLHRLLLMVSVTTVLLLIGFLARRLLRSGEGRRPRAALLLASEACRRRLAESRPVIEQHVDIVREERLPTAPRERLERVRKVVAEAPDLIVCEPGEIDDEATADELIRAQVGGTRVIDAVDLYSALTGRVPIDLIDKSWILQGGLSPTEGTMLARVRRVMSLSVGLALLAVSAPLFAVVALAILIESGRPVIFRQERLGLFRRPFTLYKFRSMVQDAEKEGPQWAAKADPRVTRVGRLLRKTRLDELPQLVNLVRGDLRLIGPRPIRQVFADRLAASIPCYDLRFLYPPGLTGWPQVIGPYGIDAEEHAVKLEMDIHYLRNGRLLDDVYILLKTVQVVLRGAGV